MQKFILLIREDLTRYPLSEEHLQRLIDAHVTWAKQLQERGLFVSGSGIGPEGFLVYADKVTGLQDLKQGLGGFYIVLADNLEQAVEIARECPTFAEGDVMEVRPLM